MLPIATDSGPAALTDNPAPQGRRAMPETEPPPPPPADPDAGLPTPPSPGRVPPPRLPPEPKPAEDEAE